MRYSEFGGCPLLGSRKCTASTGIAVGIYINGGPLFGGGPLLGGSVIGGSTVFQVKSRRWYKLTDVSQPLPYSSATICGDQVYVVGHDANGYSCSLQALPSSDQPITSHLPLSWKPLPPLPVTHSTAATLCGQLVVIGGRRRDGSPVHSIKQQWMDSG